MARITEPEDAGDRSLPSAVARLWRRLLPDWNRDHRDVAVVLVTACVCLTLLQYLGKPYRYPGSYLRTRPQAQEYQLELNRLARARPELSSLVSREMDQPHRFMPAAYRWWAGSCILLYALVPILVAVWISRGRLSRLDWMGLSPAGFLRHSWIYVLLFLAVTGPIVVVSFRSDFRSTYPFLILSHFSLREWLLFEVSYLTQFLCLEIFFRGFLLFTLERQFGHRAVYIMVVPYCMIHFGKPLLETLAAILAGCVLGELALRLRSIWGGVAIHCAVALTMDILALAHAGSFSYLLG